MVSVVEIGVIALVCGGVFFASVAAIGLLRLPDLYTRAHSASKSDTLGAVLALASVALVFGTDAAAVKTVFLLVFMFVTNPTAAHAITRAAHDQGIEPWTIEDRDTEVGPETAADSAEDSGPGPEPEATTDGGRTPSEPRAHRDRAARTDDTGRADDPGETVADDRDSTRTRGGKS